MRKWGPVVALAVGMALLVGGGGHAAPATSAQLQPPFVEAGRLFAPDGLPQEHFGYSVALRGDTLAVGTRNARVGNRGDQGAVYVYVRSGAGWVLQQKLTASDGDTNDYLGEAVVLADDVIHAGAPGASNRRGAVYEFRRSGATWTQEDKLTAPGDDHPNERFGAALDRSGDTLAVAAPDATVGNDVDAGTVYVFARSGSAWNEQARLTASDSQRRDRFGYSLALGGGNLLVGAPFHDGRFEDEGRVYAFARIGTTWIERQQLAAPAPESENQFGTAVTLDDRDAVFGAPGHDGAAREQGAAFAFAYAAGLWVYSQTLTIPAGAENADAEFGAAVAVESGLLAVGAPRNSATGQGHQGLVYTFEGGQGAWMRRETLRVPANSGEAHLGAAVAISGGALVAGAPDDDFPKPGGGFNDRQGSVTAFELFSAADDAHTMLQGTALNVPAPGVLANDSNPSGGNLTTELVSGPAHGTLTLNADGSFRYVPVANFSGADSFSYRARSGSHLSSVASVTITVVPRPIANPNSFATDQDIALTVPAPGVLANDVSGTGAPLTTVLVAGPANGTLALNPDGSFTYTPAAGFTGADSFSYKANDGTSDSEPATVSLTVNAVIPPIDPPAANDDDFSVDQDTVLTVNADTGVLANDDGDDLSASVVTGPANGTLVLDEDGSFTYTPNAGYFGPDQFTYAATNSAGSDQADALIDVIETPEPVAPPTANDDAYNVDQDSVLTVPEATGVLANDDGDSLSASLVSGPANGTLVLNADGSFTYTPDAGYNGPDQFTYAATNQSGSDEAIAMITVDEPPVVLLPPDAVDDAYATAFETTLTVPAATGVLANDGGGPATASVVAGPQHGTLTLNPDGSFTYTPAAGFSGSDGFTYQATNDAGSDQANVSLLVQPRPNRPPIAGNDSFTTLQDTPLTITAAAVLANDSDPDGDPLSFATPTPLTNPDHGVLTAAGPDSMIYTPDEGFSGIDTFTYAVTDSMDNSAPATITITVEAAEVPDPGGGGEVIVNPTPGGGGSTVIPLPAPDPVIDACRVSLDARVAPGDRVLIADARVRVQDGRRELVDVNVNRRGLRLLNESVGGIPARLRVICRTDDGEVLGKAESRIVRQRIQRIVTPPGSWVPDQGILTASGRRFVSRLAARLRPLNVIRLRCDGYTALDPGSVVYPPSLSLRRARLVCGRLQQRSLRSRPRLVPHGGNNPIASNATEAGRAANRRVAATITYGRTTRPARASLARPWSPPPPEPPAGPARGA